MQIYIRDSSRSSRKNRHQILKIIMYVIIFFPSGDTQEMEIFIQSFTDGLLILIAAPTRATNPALLDEVDITLQDDVTTQEPFLKKCIVDGNAYSHSQTVMID